MGFKMLKCHRPLKFPTKLEDFGCSRRLQRSGWFHSYSLCKECSSVKAAQEGTRACTVQQVSGFSPCGALGVPGYAGGNS